jgi:hypothetical protein
MRPLCVPVLSAVVMLAQSWSGGQSSPRLPDTGDCNDPNVQLPRAPRVHRGPADANARNINTLVIKWKRTTRIPKQAQPPTAEELQRLTRAAGFGFPGYKDQGWGVVFHLPRRLSHSEAEEIAAKIRALPEIEYAEPGRPFTIKAVPNEPSGGSR